MDDLGAAHRGGHPDLRGRVRRVLPGAHRVAELGVPRAGLDAAAMHDVRRRDRGARAGDRRVRAGPDREPGQPLDRPGAGRGARPARRARRSRPRGSAGRRRSGSGPRSWRPRRSRPTIPRSWRSCPAPHEGERAVRPGRSARPRRYAAELARGRRRRLGGEPGAPVAGGPGGAARRGRRRVRLGRDRREPLGARRGAPRGRARAGPAARPGGRSRPATPRTRRWSRPRGSWTPTSWRCRATSAAG